MIDQTARARLQEKYKQNQMQNGFNQVAALVADTRGKELADTLISQVNKLSAAIDTQLSAQFSKLSESLKKSDLTTEQFEALKQTVDAISEKVAVFSDIKEKIDAGQTIIFPKETQLSGKVDVGKIEQLPPVKVSNLSDLKIPETPKFPAFPKEMKISDLPPVFIANINELMGRIESLQNATLKAMATLKIEIPKSFAIKDPVSMQGMGDLLEYMDDLIKGVNVLIKTTQESKGADSKHPMAVEIIGDRVPRPVTNPVTNISINALGGVNLSTAVTVTTTATLLPSEPLDNRRGLVIYNNGGVTIYIGGSEVTASDGIPVAAGTYGPAIESGSNMGVYAITASGSCDVRVLEYSDIMTGRNITLPGQ